MEVLDAQVHLNRLGSIETGLVAMEAAGVTAALIDEWHGQSPTGKHRPGVELPNGAVRTLRTPIAEEFATRWPDRFAYYGRTDPLDPELEEVMAEVLSRPGCRCLRVFVQSDAEVAAFESGAYDRLFTAASKYRIPCFCWLGGKFHLLERYARKFPEIPFVIDHCGLGGLVWPGPDVKGDDRFVALKRVYPLAEYPNVSIKWSQAVRLSAERFPFSDLMPHLLKTIERFSLQRVYWGSDYTQLMPKWNWAECHMYILASRDLSEGDKEWIMGRSLRALLHWTA